MLAAAACVHREIMKGRNKKMRVACVHGTVIEWSSGRN
jgi:hypothetical protein